MKLQNFMLIFSTVVSNFQAVNLSRFPDQLKMYGREDQNPSTSTGAGIDNEPLPFFPSGLELLHSAQSERVTSLQNAFFLAVHWTLMRAGLRVVKLPLKLQGTYEAQKERIQEPTVTPKEVPGGSGTVSARIVQDPTPDRPDSMVPAPAYEILAAQMTELPEETWAEKMTAYDNEDPIKFQYVNPICPNEGYYTLTLYKMPQNCCLVRLSNPFCPAARERHVKIATGTSQRSGGAGTTNELDPVDTQGYTTPINEYIHFGPDYRTPYEIYYRVSALERIIFHMLGRMGLRLLGYIPKSISSMYEDKAPATTSTQNQRDRNRRDVDDEDEFRGGRYGYPTRPNPGGIGGDLYVPPVGGGLGRSDLDPLGRIGGGMLADPRGFRRPQTGPPGMLPPGARFDPFGPVGPNPLGPGPGRLPRGGHPTGPRPPPPFAGPNPDEPRPDGFDDMFM